VTNSGSGISVLQASAPGAARRGPICLDIFLSESNLPDIRVVVWRDRISQVRLDMRLDWLSLALVKVMRHFTRLNVVG
jgi:hypothetical protein